MEQRNRGNPRWEGGVTCPRLSVDNAYNTSMAACGELVGSLLGSTELNYVGHIACVCRTSEGTRKEGYYLQMTELARQKGLAGGQYSLILHRATKDGACLISIPHRLNGTYLSQT